MEVRRTEATGQYRDRGESSMTGVKFLASVHWDDLHAAVDGLPE